MPAGIVAFISGAALLAACAAAMLTIHPLPSEPLTFPRYLQCDPRWARVTMGAKGDGAHPTICHAGSILTSIAMALAGLGARSEDGGLVNPGSLNQWLQEHGGYYCHGGDCAQLRLTAPERFNFNLTLIGQTEKPPFAAIAEAMRARAVVHIAGVRSGAHFVLLARAHPDGKTFTVLDPLFPDETYTYADLGPELLRFHIDRYPMFKQCDVRWGSDPMGGDNRTICQAGSLLTSLSMALAGAGVTIDERTPTPAFVNRFLQANGGYTAGTSTFDPSVIAEMAPGRIVWPADANHTANDIPFANLTALLDRASPPLILAAVAGGARHVLVTGYRSDGDSLVVNDPGFDKPTYSYTTDVVGYVVFEVVRDR